MICVFASLECLCFLIQSKKCYTCSYRAVHILKYYLYVYYLSGDYSISIVYLVLYSAAELNILKAFRILTVHRRIRSVNRQLLGWYQLEIDAYLFIYSFIHSFIQGNKCHIIFQLITTVFIWRTLYKVSTNMDEKANVNNSARILYLKSRDLQLGAKYLESHISFFN